MYAATKGKNEKITGLDGQMVQLETDFEDMMRMTEQLVRAAAVHVHGEEGAKAVVYQGAPPSSTLGGRSLQYPFLVREYCAPTF